MALEAPLPTTAMVQEPEQFTPHDTVHKWMDWFYFRKVNALTKWGAMLAWIPKHGCDIPGLVFLQGHRPLMLLASWRCTLPLITGLSHDGNSQKYQEASAALLEVSISLPHPGQSTSLFKLLLQATEFLPSRVQFSFVSEFCTSLWEPFPGYKIKYPSASTCEWVAFQCQVYIPEFGQCLFTRIKSHVYTDRQTSLERAFWIGFLIILMPP